ncbi:hypothetical protein RHSIM_Rhsim01G0222100 [Rhododendron simsii]|uniref:Cytochrome P450 n=1 Tax=Rhododendron simsii TaxID=118357 RepID=A0A834HDQ5_RHOSS|nr:hypothetical protein RHSIM_Rhsim01G0222100 [Rhododendron simsii]
MECFTTNDRAFVSRPKSAAMKYMEYDGAISAIGPHGPYWRKLREVMTIELLSNRRRRYGLSEDEKDGEARLFTRAMDQFMFLTGAFECSNMIPFFGWMDLQGHLRLMKQNAKVMDCFMSRWLEEHVQSPKNGQVKEEQDFMDVLLSIFPEDGMEHGRTNKSIIKGTALSLILGGSDTTTAAMTWALSLLLNHKKSLKLVQQELDTHVGRERWVEESDIEDLNYLQASVKKTLRLYPSSPLLVPREAIQDCHMAGSLPNGGLGYSSIWEWTKFSASLLFPPADDNPASLIEVSKYSVVLSLYISLSLSLSPLFPKWIFNFFLKQQERFKPSLCSIACGSRKPTSTGINALEPKVAMLCRLSRYSDFVRFLFSDSIKFRKAFDKVLMSSNQYVVP